MEIACPGRGVLRLQDDVEPGLFRWLRVALGTLGVVQELTLKVIPRYTLHERTYCVTYDELERHHKRLLQTYRHVRYMWVPYTDTVVVVVSDVAEPGAEENARPPLPEEQRVEPLKALLRNLVPDCGDLEGKNFAQLRERLLELDPLNPKHVAQVNQAEAEFWKLSEGERVADSTAILGFECGGAQWVLENCFPCGTIDEPNLADIRYVKEMKEIIERKQIAAASPIEQRWTSRSTSFLSPAYAAEEKAIFSWVGVIMYITEKEEEAIRAKFREYAKEHVDLTFKYDGFFHWGKVDLKFHESPAGKAALRAQLARKFDLRYFQKLKEKLDPANVLGNALTDFIYETEPGTRP